MYMRFCIHNQVNDSKMAQTRITRNSNNKLSNAIFTKLQTTLNVLIQENNLNPQTLLYIVANLMEAVGQYKKLTGVEKKNLVINLVNDAIDADGSIQDKIKTPLKLMMRNVVPGAIDIMVDISKNQYKFKYITGIWEFLKSLNCKCDC